MKFLVKEKVYFINFWGFELNFESARIEYGEIETIEVRNKNTYRISYGNNSHYSTEIPEKRLFKTRDEAEMWIYNKFVKGKK